MPVSKNRKGHNAKTILRKTRIADKKAHLENMYKEMMFQLKDKDFSVADMLNKEDELVKLRDEQILNNI
jgi:hypothetical protein